MRSTAYLGVPLVTSHGTRSGPCAPTTAPAGRGTDRDVAVLEGLASSVVSELELRVLSQELATRAAQLDLALSAADIGCFDLDVDTGDLQWDDRLIACSATSGRPSVAVSRTSTPGCTPTTSTASAPPSPVHRDVGDLAAEYRVLRPDSMRWVEARGRAPPGPDGPAARLLGVAYDSTELRQARDRLARCSTSMGDAFYSLDPQWRFTFVNTEAERLLGRTREELLGAVLWQEFPARARLGLRHGVPPRCGHRHAASFEAYYPPPLDGWYEVRAWPTPDGLSVYFREITDRRRTEAEREQAVVERERAYAAAEAANQRLAFIADASHVLAQTLEPLGVLARLSELVLPALGESVWVALVGDAASQLLGRELPDGDAVHVVHVDHTDPGRRAQLEALARVLPVSTHDAVGAGAVIRTGVPEWLPDIPAAALSGFVTDETPIEELVDAASGTALTVPLVSRGRTIGAVTVGEPPSGQVDRALLTDLASRAAVALDNALLYGAERRTGLTLQRSLLPGQLPKLPDVEIAVRYLPGATGAFVGGDWYQGVVVGEDLVLCMGDVMGHGMRSAARMGQLRAIVATLALEGHGPGELLRRLAANSDVLLDLELATLLVARYSPSERTLVVASAGHPPPLLAPVGRTRGTSTSCPDPPVGAFVGTYAETVVDAAPDLDPGAVHRRAGRAARRGARRRPGVAPAGAARAAAAARGRRRPRAGASSAAAPAAPTTSPCS